MNAENYWRIFLETGAPELYLMYTQARKTEERDAFNSTSAGITGNELQ